VNALRIAVIKKHLKCIIKLRSTLNLPSTAGNQRCPVEHWLSVIQQLKINSLTQGKLLWSLTNSRFGEKKKVLNLNWQENAPTWAVGNIPLPCEAKTTLFKVTEYPLITFWFIQVNSRTLPAGYRLVPHCTSYHFDFGPINTRTVYPLLYPVIKHNQMLTTSPFIHFLMPDCTF
jgi:hypothetical protein